MLHKLSKQKRIGVICELIGFAVLILAAAAADHALASDAAERFL